MRLFVAVYPGAEAVAAWQKFQAAAPNWPLRWIPAESLHFTLKFLGSTEPAQEPALRAVLERAAGLVSPFTLRLRGGGVFPPKGAPSVFWLGVEGDTRVLTELANMAELEFKNLGFPVEPRAFSAHLTVARPRDKTRPLPRAIAQEFSEWAQSFRSPDFSVKELCLVESHLGATGSSYQVRASYPFRRE